MAGEIGTAFVRIRPNMTGFRAETEAGVKSAFSGVGKAIAGAVAVGGLFQIGKHLIEAASENQAAFAILEGSIKSAGAQLKVFGKDVEEVVAKEARLKGFSDEELASAMVRLVSATGNTKKAFQDLGLAEDLARARHIDVATAALALSKAEQGNFTSLQRYGIIVKSAAGETVKLKEAHDKAVAAGATFTASQKQQYAAALAAAGATDKQAKAVAAIALVEERFGGASKTFAEQASGQFARLKEDMNQLAEAAGMKLLPAATSAAGGLANLTEELVDSGKVQEVFASGVKSIGSALSTLKSVAETVGPPLLTVATAALKVVETIGATPLLVAVATYKAVGIAVGIAVKAKLTYLAISAAGAKAEATEAAATTANTAATAANTVSKGANVVATEAEAAATTQLASTTSSLVLRIQAATAANAELAISAGAAAAALDAQAVGSLANFGRGLAVASRGIGRLSLALVGGPFGAAVLGIAALAGGIAYLVTRDSEWEAANKRVESSLRGLTAATAAQEEATTKLARAAASTNVREETDKTIASLKKLAAASVHRADVADVKSLTQANPGRTDLVLKQYHSAAEAAKIAAAGVKLFNDELGQQILTLGKNDPLLAHNLELLGELATAVGRVPTELEIELLLNNKDPKAAIEDIMNPLRFLIGAFNDLGKAVKDATGAPGVTGTWPGIIDAIQQAADATPAIQAQIDKQVVALNKQLSTLTAAGDAALATQRADLAAQEAAGRQQIADAVASAQQNVVSIGQAISSSIAAVIDKPLQVAQDAITRAQDRIALTFDKAAAPYAKQAQLIQLSQDRIALKYDMLADKLQPAADKLSRENAQAQLASDKLALANLRAQVLLPGGKSLAADPTKALEQLRKLAAGASATTKASIEAFVLTYSAAFRAVQGDQLSLKQNAQALNRRNEETPLNRATARSRVETDRLEILRSNQERPLQLQSNELRVEQGKAAAAKTAAARRIDDLTAAFTAGKIGFSTLSDELSAVLAKNDTGFKRAGKLLGSAFRASFEAQFTGLGLQATALEAGPQRPGAGLLPTITKPGEVVETVLRQNAKSADELTKAQIELAKKQNALLTKIHNAQTGTKFNDSLTHNPGDQTTTSNALRRAR